MIERIYMKEMSIALGGSKTRTIKKWCSKNNVKLFKEGKQLFAIKIEFEAVHAKTALSYLTEKFGKDKLPEVVQAYMNVHSELLSNAERKNTNYVLSGDHSAAFLKRLTALKSRL